MPKISVIVPVYKVEQYLDRCVQSILDQTFEDFELILVDDGSPDGCPALCDAWAERDSRIQVIHKENGGLSDARNVGFEASAGEWITFIDSDDYVHSKMLEALYDAVQEHGVKVSVCGFVKTDGTPLAEDQELAAKLWTPESFYRERNVNATVAWGKLYRRDMVLPYPKGKLHEDEYVTYRILFACEHIAVVDGALYGYFHNTEGITKGKTFSVVRKMHKLEALQEQFLYFRDTGKADPARAATSYWINACGILKALEERKLPEYAQTRDRVKVMYPVMKPWLNKYEKLYVYLLRYRWAPAWLIQNDFAPVQNWLGKIKRIMGK